MSGIYSIDYGTNRCSKKAGVKFYPPFKFEISDHINNGTNKIDIIVSSSVSNLLGKTKSFGIMKKNNIKIIRY
jgi:hypothetical protein